MILVQALVLLSGKSWSWNNFAIPCYIRGNVDVYQRVVWTIHNGTGTLDPLFWSWMNDILLGFELKLIMLSCEFSINWTCELML